jgi:hypothetical protein
VSRCEGIRLTPVDPKSWSSSDKAAKLRIQKEVRGQVRRASLTPASNHRAAPGQASYGASATNETQHHCDVPVFACKERPTYAAR